MTVKEEYRIARKCHKKAIKYLHISNKYPVLSPECDYYWKQYVHFRKIFDAHEGALKRFVHAV